MTRRPLLIALMLFLTTPAFGSGGMQAPKLTEEEAYSLGIQAYVYAYPLVLTEITKLVGLIKSGTSLNQFAHAQAIPTPESKTGVRPNVDTLYSIAWLDLSQEPVILSVPDTGDRYYLVQLLDAWTETFAVPGTRTTGTKQNDFAITGPGWQGSVPKGTKEIKAPTNTVLVAGRIQTNGVDDYKNVFQLQRRFKLTLLRDWSKSATSRLALPYKNDLFDINTPPSQQVEEMDMQTFFETFAQSLKTNPPHEADAPLVTQLEAIGIVAGKNFDSASLAPDIIKGLEKAVIDAPAEIEINSPEAPINNGWGFPTKGGRYGTDYFARAAVALFGFGALPPEDAVCPGAWVDSENIFFNGASHYVLHFEKTNLPPVRAFWSITLYGPDGFFIANTINRYALGDRDNLSYNTDGSLDIYIQHNRPETEKEPNWLPCPADGGFSLAMRLYWPKPEVTNGTWKPPAVNRVH